jgi:quercetin dioxygenase-like cupin family protein
METLINTNEKFVLTEAVTYSTQSVVSKAVLKRQTGNVTLFAFDRGEGLSEHIAPFDAMVHVLDGLVEIKIEGQPHLLKEGDAIIMPANVPHALKALERFKMMLIMIKENG